MQSLSVDLRDCYGIKHLQHKFDFTLTAGKRHGAVAAAYAVYAPNGVMKISFARTFVQLANGQQPAEERFGRQATATQSAQYR